MPERKAATKSTTKRTMKRTASKGFTAEERAAMRERATELRSAERAGKTREAGERAVLEKIGQMPKPDRTMAERIHAIVTATAPGLAPRTWYGMPAYANEDGKVVCFFTPASKFKERYATFGFNADANLDEGTMWPTSWALTELTPADEKKIAALVKKAVR
jgi:uncharacterized protein YdhG (YjbR/CyaY superfamily)